jgi:uncharacterized protein DUF5320
MPGGDRTGPAGSGPMTGRQAGYCTGNNAPGYTSAPLGGGFGRGFGRGMGGGQGRGFGRGFGRGIGAGWVQQPAAAPIAPVQASNSELDMLKAQSEAIQNTLENINQRIQKLEESSAS